MVREKGNQRQAGGGGWCMICVSDLASRSTQRKDTYQQACALRTHRRAVSPNHAAKTQRLAEATP